MKIIKNDECMKILKAVDHSYKQHIKMMIYAGIKNEDLASIKKQDSADNVKKGILNWEYMGDDFG